MRLVNVLPYWSGHVYNLSTADGYFAINGVYTGNTVGANNQGSLASWSELAAASGVEATKTWLATSDNRTRPDHADVNGTTVGINETFDVGGTAMNGPGDPSAGPEQCCNCRCSATFDFPEDTPWQVEEQITEEADLTAALVNGEAPTGVCIMAMLSAADAARCAIPEGEPADGMHVTLAYLAQPAVDYSPDVKASLLASLTTLVDEGFTVQADAFALALFNPNSEERDPAAVLLVQSDALASVHDAVAEFTASLVDDTFPIWIPHLTVAYNADVTAIPPGALGPLTFDRLVLAWGPDQIDVADPAAQTDPVLTAASEAPVTAPPVAPPAAPDAAPAAPPSAAPDLGVDLTPIGQTWSGPLALLNVPSSDRRVIAAGGGVFRPFPLPISWQEKSDDDHDGSVIVGRILAAEDRGDVIWGTGDYLNPMMNFAAEQAMAQVDAGLGLISVDLAVLTGCYCDSAGNPIDPMMFPGDGDDVCEMALEWEFGGATIVSFPAFADARISNDPMPEEGDEMGAPMMDGEFAGATPVPASISEDGITVTLQDGTTVAVGDPIGYPGEAGATEVGTISGIDAAAAQITVTPAPAEDGTQPPDLTVPVTALQPATETPAGTGEDPAQSGAMTLESITAAAELRPYTRSLFDNREIPNGQHLSYDAKTGAVYGFISEFGACHVGKLGADGSGPCVDAPHSQRDYADFNITPIPMDDGTVEYVGRLTVGTGHAPDGVGYTAAVEHYDNTGTQVALVRAYENDWGVKVFGQVIHDVPQHRVEELMRSEISPDWRLRGGNLEMCAALAVNSGGFPNYPVWGMSRSKRIGQVSLVAAGMLHRTEPRVLDAITLPSGATVTAADLEAMTAAMLDAMSATKAASDARASLALTRARLALTGV